MGLLRRRGDGYYTDEDPTPMPIVGIRPGGSMYDLEEQEREERRAAVEEERRQARLKADNDLAEQDAERAREEEESMTRFYEQQLRVELPDHLKDSAP